MGNVETQKIELPIADIWIDNNEIVRMDFNQTERHSLEDAKQLTEAHAKLCKNERRPVLADMRGITIGADKDARNYYASTESSRLKSALAMVTNSRAQRTFGAIYLFLTRPPYPTKLFTSQSKALAWLESFQNQE